MHQHTAKLLLPLASLTTTALLGLGISIAAKDDKPAVSAETVEKIAAALPKSPPAKPSKQHHVLVFTKTNGFRHGSIATGVEAMRQLGEATGAFRITHTEDHAVFAPDSLKQFDAVLMLNTTGNLFRPHKNQWNAMSQEEKDASNKQEEALQKSLLDFIENGGGLAGIHSATDTFYNWPEYGEMMGGYFDGHPWNAGTTVTVKNEQPKHKIGSALGTDELVIKDEIYQLKDPYSRDRLDVILSLDNDKTDMTLGGIKREDKDFAVSWTNSRKKGRIFYCSLGHNDHIYWTPEVLNYYLAGLQYVLGDL